MTSQESWEYLLDSRAIPINLNKTYKYQPMYENNNDNLNYRQTVLRGVYDKNQLNQLFFSEENIKNVDKQLRYTVYLMSNKQYKLGPQDLSELVIIMRAVFLTYSKNLSRNITQQIETLNNLVIKNAAPDLLSNTTQYLRYLEDKNESHKILIARPINVSNAGIKLLNTGSAIGV